MPATIEEIVVELRQGKAIILADDEQRENEGDLIFAAEAVNPELINFMMVHARGLICLTLTEERCKHLQLPLMQTRNKGNGFQTAFTVSIEAATGVTTGISASDRARTIAAAVAKTAQATDLVTPGHIFPLMAKPGGVLERPGHTEAGCDLMKLAGLIPAAVICEITMPDGSMARMPDLRKLAELHNLRLSTVEELIKFRLANESIIKRQNKEPINTSTPYGPTKYFEYRDQVRNGKHIALVYGLHVLEKNQTIKEAEIYTHCSNDVTNWLKIDENKKWSLMKACQYFSKSMENKKIGILLLLDEVTVRSQTAQKIEKNSGELNKSMVSGLRKQICADLGIEKLHLLNS